MLDQVVLLTCKGSSRLEKTVAQLRAQGLTNFVIHEVEKDEEDGRRGCWNSHQQIMRNAHASGKKRVLILEDDAYLLKPWKETEAKINETVSSLNSVDPDWKFLTLASYILNSRTEAGDIRMLKCAVGGAAYIPNLQNFEDISEYGEASTIYVDIHMFCDHNVRVDKGGVTGQILNSLSNKEKQTHVYALDHPLFIPDPTAESEIGHIESKFFNLQSENSIAFSSTVSENRWGIGLMVLLGLVASLLEFIKMRSSGATKGEKKNKVLTVIASFFAVDRLYMGQRVLGLIKLGLIVASLVLLYVWREKDNGWYGLLLLLVFIVFWFIDQARVYANAILMSDRSPFSNQIVFDSNLRQAQVVAVVMVVALFTVFFLF